MTLGRLWETKAAGHEVPLVHASGAVSTVWSEHGAPGGFLGLGEMKQEGTGPAVTNPKGFLSLWTSLLKEYGSRTNRKLSTIGKSFCSFTYEKKKKLALLSRGCTPVSQALSPGPFLELLPRGLSRRALAILCWNVSLLLDSSVLIIFTCYF